MQTNKKMTELSWPEIEAAFQSNCTIIIPLGAACKEHGYHLPMNTDLLMANALADYVSKNYEDVLIAPPITDNYFPAFEEYPGSASLTLETATNLIVERCKVWYKQGAKKFYIINNGVSTNKPLAAAKTILEQDCPQILFDYLDLTLYREDQRIKNILMQKSGTHADELETSMMLLVAPHVVDLKKAIPADTMEKLGPLTRDPHATDKTISVSGTWGDPTLATKEKGIIGFQVLCEIIDQQLQKLTSFSISKKSR